MASGVAVTHNEPLWAGFPGVGRRAFSLDGKSYQELGEDVPLRFSQWKGSRVALFCYGSGGGHVDIDEVHYACRDRQAGR